MKSSDNAKNTDLSQHEEKNELYTSHHISDTLNTALIHVHGIGQQERFHEIGKLTDALKKWWQLNLPDQKFEFDVKYEITHSEVQDETISYFQIKVDHDHKQHFIDIYEVYWAPLAGRGPSDISIIFWIIKNVLIPIKRMASDWNQYHYIRSSTLQHMKRKDKCVQNSVITKSEVQQLIKLYDYFYNRDQHSYGSKFKDFLQLIKDQNNIDNQRLIHIAKAWRARYAVGEIGNFIIVIGIGFGVFGIILAAVVFVRTIAFPEGSFNYFTAIEPVTKKLYIASFSLALIYIFFIRRYIREWLGDVKIWVTHQETASNYSIRKNILNNARQTFSHVIRKYNGLNNRTIVLGHSLGSTIAYETLLSLSEDQLTNDTFKLALNKISHFFTYGSPIDKIHYFFEARSAKDNTKSNALQHIREKPIDYLLNQSNHQMQWLNFHDHGDAIGGPLETPRLPGQMSSIDNIYTPNAYFPTIITNHAEYTNNNHMLTYLWHALIPSLKLDKIQQPCEMETSSIEKHIWLMHLGQITMIILLYTIGLGMTSYVFESIQHNMPAPGITRSEPPSFKLTSIFFAISLISFLAFLSGCIVSLFLKHPDPISDSPNKSRWLK